MKHEFKRGDKANVILGSSVDKTKGEMVIIEEIINHADKTTVNCITIKTKHKFWCYYSDLLPIIQ